MELNPSIFYYLYIDEDVFSDELVLLFPDSTFYLERTAPMVLQYTMGRYTCHGDSVFLTSYQVLDTLDILKVEEYWNPAASYSTIVVFDENNCIDDSRFLLNGALDTLWSDSNWVLRYEGDVNEIKVSVASMRRFSRYTVRTPHKNVFFIQVNSKKKHAEAGGVDIILENRLFIKRINSLFDPLYERDLIIQNEIPEGISLCPFSSQR